MFYLWWQDLARISGCVYNGKYADSDTYKTLIFCRITITDDQWDRWDLFY